MKFEVFIEKYRLFIGVILVLAIVCGSAVLIWRENYQKPKVENRLTVLEQKISELEQESQSISNSKFLISNQNSNDSMSNVQAEAQNAGQVAGTTSQAVAG